MKSWPEAASRLAHFRNVVVSESRLGHDAAPPARQNDARSHVWDRS